MIPIRKNKEETEMAKKKNSHGGAPQSDPISAGEQGASGEYTTLGGEGMAEY